MSFQISGLSPEPFQPLFGLPEDDLRARGILRYTAEAGSAYPDRIELREATPGETLLLLNYEYQPAASPYRGRHAIFVREGADQAYHAVNQVPEMLRRRLLSLRAFDPDGMLVEADVLPGTGVEALVERLFDNPETAYIHVHNAREGCYHARIDRAD